MDFKELFGGNNFLLIDNNQYQKRRPSTKRFGMLVKKGLKNS